MKRYALSIAVATVSAAAAAILFSCSDGKTVYTVSAPPVQPQALDVKTADGKFLNSRPAAIPKATAFKMSGNYADKVAVTLGADGELTYFPDPRDIKANSSPTKIGEGWWLNRQGFGANAVFTKWTFAQYSALKQVPSVEEIKAAIIPGARVTEFRQLPIPMAEAEEVPVSDLLDYLE